MAAGDPRAGAPASAGTAEAQPGRANLMLVLATVGFAINFWAWSLIAPLGGTYGEELGLSAVQVSAAVAVPVIVGSLGRIPAGALTDRFGARIMFPLVSLLTTLPVLFVGLVANSFPMLLLGGFFLGLGGTTFAVGVPFVNAWFTPERRGTALGLFGMGTAGTAIASFTTVDIAAALGRSAPFLLVAALLAIYAGVAWFLLRDAPGRAPMTTSAWTRTRNTLALPATWQLSLLYAISFGGFVAFSVYLPTYLVNAYDLDASDAAIRTAGFVVLAVVMRPVGGWMSDRWHPVPVLAACFGLAAALAVLAAAEPALMPFGTVAFLGLAAVLGAGAGATFALVSRLAPPGQVGSVTGVVGAAGGLGGFFPPLVMGAVYGQTGDYTLGFVLLAVAALGTAAFTWWPVRRATRD